jgi:hypothetical protein
MRKARRKLGTFLALFWAPVGRLPLKKEVLGAGLEPASLSAYAPQTYVSASSTTRALCGSVKTFRRRQPLASALSVLPYKLRLCVGTRESDSVTLEPYASSFASLAMMCAWARHILKRSPRYSWRLMGSSIRKSFVPSLSTRPS